MILQMSLSSLGIIFCWSQEHIIGETEFFHIENLNDMHYETLNCTFVLWYMNHAVEMYKGLRVGFSIESWPFICFPEWNFSCPCWATVPYVLCGQRGFIIIWTAAPLLRSAQGHTSFSISGHPK